MIGDKAQAPPRDRRRALRFIVTAVPTLAIGAMFALNALPDLIDKTLPWLQSKLDILGPPLVIREAIGLVTLVVGLGLLLVGVGIYLRIRSERPVKKRAVAALVAAVRGDPQASAPRQQEDEQARRIAAEEESGPRDA